MEIYVDSFNENFEEVNVDEFDSELAWEDFLKSIDLRIRDMRGEIFYFIFLNLKFLK